MELDWNKCVICQQEKPSEPLKCPMQGPASSCEKRDVYSSFIANVVEFRDLTALPTSIYFRDNVSAADFETHRASWHKSCHLKFNNSKLIKARKRKAKNTDDPEQRPPSKRQAVKAESCVFCAKGCEEGDLHQVSTYDANSNIQTMITVLQETELLGRVDGGDLIAKETKYHLKCLTSLRNRYRSHVRKQSQDEEKAHTAEENMNTSRVFVELVSYIEKAVDSGTSFFKLSDIHSLYMNRLKDFGISKGFNKTRLKERVLKHFPESQEQYDGRNTIITFNKAVQSILREALKKRDFSEDANILAKAATIIRTDIFSHNSFQFTGCFPSNCQEDSLPSSLKLLISLIFNSPNLKDQDRCETQECLTVCQVIVYNTKKRASDSGATKTRHSLDREPPLPIYIGLNLHQVTRSKKLIHQMHQVGICTSYDRVLEIEDGIAAAVSEQFQGGVVAPACLRKGLFTLGALDNLDHNPSSTTAVNAFHGTGISLFQFPTRGDPGESRPPITISPSRKKQHYLPNSYAVVPAVALTASAVEVPALQLHTCFDEVLQLEEDVPVVPIEEDGAVFPLHAWLEDMPLPNLTTSLDEAKAKESRWVEHALVLIDKGEITSEDAIAWAAYHASQQTCTEDPPALCALLPLFYEKAATPAMIKHGMDVQREAIQYLNPGQIPVTTFDQPLFALAKLVQWKWPVTHGESVHVVMLGGLHVEMALWNTLGDLLEASGWTTALVEADIASSGTADSFLKVSHLTRTRHAHQVTLLTLQKLQREAFVQSESNLSKAAWRNDMLKKSPTFMFWDLVLRYETLILIFVRAHREKNFSLYVQVLEELTPLFFALDHVNYSRWMPVHIRDMKNLPGPIKNEFEQQCHWVISKTNKKFSAIPIDQAHEQENAFVKGSGGCIGLTENPVAFRRWMLSGPELARLQREFEEEYLPDTKLGSQHFQHHEQGHATQKEFLKQATSLFKTIQRMGNPFLDDFPELVTLDSRNCVDVSVSIALYAMEETGKRKYQDFVKRVLEDRTSSIHDPIKKNSLALYRKPKPIPKQGKIKILQNNVALFSQLYISMQSREGDLHEFFAHEIQPFPPSLSDLGKLYLPGTKSDMLNCIEQCEVPACPSMYGCTVLDGAVIVHILSTKAVCTFSEYAEKVFIPYLIDQLQSSSRVDVVWDTYIADSLKESTREKRGKGLRRKVSSQTKLPSNWMDFLRDSTNKKELFAFLTSKVTEFTFPPNKAVYITCGESVVSSGLNSVAMPDCNHEEADTRIVVHLLHALEHGLRTIKVRTADSDVIAILVGAFFDLISAQPSADIWVAFGTGKNFRFYSINTICSSIGEPRARALPVFHAWSGCDTTSAFRGRGKKSAWQAWKAYEEVTQTFTFLAAHPFEHLHTDSDHFQKIERLTVVLYDKTSSLSSVNEAREELFCRKNRSIDNIPPTQNALLQHTQRAVYQAGIWTTSTQVHQVVPSPSEFGWSKSPTAESWVPVWITIPEVSKACNQLIRCACKGDCSRCKCAKANLPCSPLCSCKCNQNTS